MNNKTIFVIQTFLVPILLPDNHAHLPSVHPGCQSDISVFLKTNGGTKREERALIRSFTGEVCCLWWQGSTISFVTPPSYFCTYSTTVLFLFSQAKRWKLHNRHSYLQITQRATVCYTGTLGSVSPSLSVGFMELKPFQVRHKSGGCW